MQHPGEVLPLFFFFLLLLLFPAPSSALQHLTTAEEEEDAQALVLPQVGGGASPPASQQPTTFFEVSRPIDVPRLSKRCSVLVLQHDFGSTYGQPPVTSPFTPCAPVHPSRIALEWSASCRGRQFDRIFGVWVGGVELLRSCTAEPRANGIVWTVSKDVTRYASLLSRPQTLAIHLANIVDGTYTGVYHVNVSLHYYYGAEKARNPRGEYGPAADVVVPVSRDLPINDGLWFIVQNASDPQGKDVAIPRNSYRGVLEVYVSFHQGDEFWYSNAPNDYIAANNLSSDGNGPFREVTVSVDDTVVGAVWPFTVIYTGGINPLLWRPISAIGSFDLPSYDIEITPFLGGLLDGKPHKFSFSVTNAAGSWFIDANLHLWLDRRSSYTTGKLIKHNAPEVVPSLVSKFRGLDGSFLTTASRQISATGWVKSSHGKIVTHSYQDFTFRNLMVYSGNGSAQVINQTIKSDYGIYAENPGSVIYAEQVFREFPLHLHMGTTDMINGSYAEISNVSLSFNEKRIAGEKFGFSFSSLKNSQEGHGQMVVKGHLVQNGVAGTGQRYMYEGIDGCYFRNVRSDNYTILHDDSGNICSMNSQLGSWGASLQQMSFL